MYRTSFVIRAKIRYNVSSFQAYVRKYSFVLISIQPLLIRYSKYEYDLVFCSNFYIEYFQQAH